MLTLQDVIKIQLEEQNNLQALQNNLADVEKEIDKLFDTDNGIKRFKQILENAEKLAMYDSLNNTRTIIQVHIDKQVLIVQFINEYVKGLKGAIAYNYYVSELQRRVKIHNVLENACIEINELEEKLAGNRNMQYNSGSITNGLRTAARCLPWVLYKQFNK